jgi:hypothetical protein
LIEQIPPDWLPEISEGPYSDDDIQSLAECASPLVAAGSCLLVSEAIADYLHSTARTVEEPHHYEVVQGLDDSTRGLSSHYALLLQLRPSAAPVILDFTFAQIDSTAPFPLVVSPTEWSRLANELEGCPAYMPSEQQERTPR